VAAGILPHPDGDLTCETDVLVIGSGAGGAVVAAALAERGRRVLILEEGGYFRTSDFKTGNSHDRYLNLYRDGGMTAALGLPLVLIPLGKTVGGTTTINSGTCLRVPDGVLAGWRERFGLSDLTATLVAPYYDRVEKFLGVMPVPEVLQGGNFGMIDRGLKALGLAGSALLRNAPGCQAAGECCFGCPSGGKLSMEQSYVPHALKAGARLFTSCRVERVTLSGHRATGATARFIDPARGKKMARLTVTAKSVIVACGTLFSPVLLKRSGVVSSHALGRHMTVHPTAKAIGIFDDEIAGQRGVPQGYHTEFLHGRGLLFESIFYPPWLMAANYGGVGEAHREFMAAYQRAGVFAFLISDDANGRVVTMPDGRPLLLYSFGRREHELYLEGTRWLGKILFAAGARKVFTGVHSRPVIENPADLETLTPDRIKRHELETVAFHPLGTCRMGLYPHESVVDGNLRVHDYDNLFIADGSVFPSSLGVNPQMTIMAFATRLGQSLD
jgi:choline dehydrogenase-like flavoprotein